MKSIIDGMKNISLCENTVTIRSSMKESDKEKLTALADELLAD